MISDKQKSLDQVVKDAKKAAENVTNIHDIGIDMLTKLANKMTDEEKKNFQFLVGELTAKMETNQIDALNNLIKEWELK